MQEQWSREQWFTAFVLFSSSHTRYMFRKFARGDNITSFIHSGVESKAWDVTSPYVWHRAPECVRCSLVGQSGLQHESQRWVSARTERLGQAGVSVAGWSTRWSGASSIEREGKKLGMGTKQTDTSSHNAGIGMGIWMRWWTCFKDVFLLTLGCLHYKSYKSGMPCDFFI